MRRDSRFVLKQFAWAAVAAALLWLGSSWLAGSVIRAILRG